MKKFVERIASRAKFRESVDQMNRDVSARPAPKSKYYYYGGEDYDYERGGSSSFNPEDENHFHRDRSPSVWVRPGDTVRVGKHEVKGGFFYFGDTLDCPHNGYVQDPSLVDPTLRYIAGRRDLDLCLCRAEENMTGGYYVLEPYERAGYLEWLAGDRDNPELCGGFVFLYFCGIERRILIDDQEGEVSDTEFVELLAELRRLQQVYGAVLEDFGASVTGLLSYVVMTNQRAKGHASPDIPSLEESLHLPDVYKVPLARAAANGYPVSPEVALAWLRNHPDHGAYMRAMECAMEFEALFRLRYRHTFGEGIVIKPTNKISLVAFYDTANSTIGRIESRFNLPNASLLKTPFRQLVKLLRSCADELAPFDSLIRGNGGSRDCLEAVSLLPADFLAEGSYPALEHIKTLLEGYASGSGGLIPAAQLLEYMNGNRSEQPGEEHEWMISNVAEKAGFGTAPDARYHDAAADIDGNITVFPGGHGDDFAPSVDFRKIMTVLRMGSMALGDDRNMDSPGARILRSQIDGNRRLTETEKRSLRAYLLWRIQAPRSQAGLRAQIKILDAREKAAAASVALSTAVADGATGPDGIRRLEGIYRLLGLDKNMVSSDMHALLSSRGKQSRADAGIHEISSGSAASGLNIDLVNMYEEETRNVRGILENIFEDEECAVDNVAAADTERFGMASGLDEKNRRLYEKLVARPQWSSDEVRKLCGEMELMVDGSIEMINDWAFENTGAPLIEVGSSVLVDQEVAKAIHSL